jgi:hypothetical protein
MSVRSSIAKQVATGFLIDSIPAEKGVQLLRALA